MTRKPRKKPNPARKPRPATPKAEEPATLLYPCCNVSAVGLADTPCWSCEAGEGVRIWIPSQPNLLVPLEADVPLYSRGDAELARRAAMLRTSQGGPRNAEEVIC